jgi:hypothetical protein
MGMPKGRFFLAVDRRHLNEELEGLRAWRDAAINAIFRKADLSSRTGGTRRVKPPKEVVFGDSRYFHISRPWLS